MPTSAVRILVDLCLKSDERNVFQRANAIFWLPRMWEPVKRPEHSFLLKNKNCYQVVSVVSDALSAKAKRAKLLAKCIFIREESRICMDMKRIYRASANI